jgi:hypothetical protein
VIGSNLPVGGLKPLKIVHNPNWGPDCAKDGKIGDVRMYPYVLNKEQVNLVRDCGAVSVG